MIDPPRLLDSSDEGFGTRLLRSAERDKPSPRATRRALGVAVSAASAASAAGFGAASAAAAGGGALAKSVITWLLVGGLGGTVVSVSARRVVERSAEREAHGVAVVAAPATKTRSTSTLAPARVAEDAALPSPVAVPEPLPLPVAASPQIEPVPGHAEATRSSGARALRTGQVPPDRVVQAPPRAPSVSGTGAAAGDTFSLGTPRSGAEFSDEMRLIDGARQRLSAGDAVSALDLLARYEATFSGGHFLPEALALRVEALAVAGQAGNARRAAERFLSGYPGHPLSTRVRAAIGSLP